MASVDILDIVNQDRNKFGIKDSDFHRYRVHCTNKLKNLRKSIGLQQVNHKTKKFEKYSFDLQAIQNNHPLHLKHLLINLFQVEHSWASSREIREQIKVILKKNQQLRSNPSNSSSPTGVSRLRKHVQNRLAKAIQHSDQLLDLCNLPSNPLAVETLAQVYVHRLYMKGLFDFELARWETSLNHFVVSFVILDALGKSRTNETDSHKKRVIFFESMDELSPLIRYCSYKLGLDSIEIDKFSQERFDKNLIGQQLIQGTHWNQIKSLVDTSKGFSQPVIELKFINKQISIGNPEWIELINAVKKADQILLPNLQNDLMLHATDQNQLLNLNKKQKRKLFLQSRNPKLPNCTDFLTCSTVGFDQALAIYIDVENSLQRLIESNNRALELNPTIQRFDVQSQSLSTIHEIVAFRLLSTRVNRDVGLIEKVEKKLKKQQMRIEDRSRENPTNYQNIDRLIMVSKQNNLGSKENANFTIYSKNQISQNVNSQVLKIDLIKSLLNKRRQAKLFPSLLKLIEDILFNLDRIKQLNLIQHDDLISLKIESKISFFKAYRCFIQSKSYLLTEKFAESYILQQKSNFYIRRTRSTLEEIEQEEEEEEFDNEQENRETDLNSNFLKLDRARLEFLGDEFQDKLKLDIIQEWIRKKEEHGASCNEETIAQAESELKNLSLLDNDSKTKEITLDPIGSTVFDLAFNHLTQFDWDRLLDNHHQSSVSATQSTVHKIHSPPSAPSSQPTDPPEPSIDPTATPPPAKKSGGLWSFFSRS